MKRVIVCGWVRCGNQWLQRLFQSYFGQQLAVEVSHLTVGSHFDSDLRWDDGPYDTYFIHTQRDPRDAIVSWYYWLSQGELYIPEGITFQEYLSWLIEEHYYPLRTYAESWLKLKALRPANVSWTSHERALADREGELRRFLSEMGHPVDEVRANLSARLLEREPPRPAYPQLASETEPCGISGKWKTHFDAEDARLIEDYCGDLIVRLGYGGDPDWERLLERNERD
jgi:hypothetical protein